MELLTTPRTGLDPRRARAMELYAFDSFTDTDGTFIQNHDPDWSGAGYSWLQRGNWPTIEANRFSGATNSGTHAGMFGGQDMPTPDYKAACTIRAVTSTVRWGGILLRNDGTNSYRIGWENGSWIIARAFDNGAWISTLASESESVTLGRDYYIEAEARGNRLILSVDGRVRLEASDHLYPGPGRPGLSIRKPASAATTTGWFIDDFRVWLPAARIERRRVLLLTFQYLRPAADSQTDRFEDEGGATTDLYQSVDEVVPSAADFVVST